MTPVIVTSATLLVVIAATGAALFPLDTQVAPGAFETIGVATAAIIGNHCVREWPERQGEAAHTAPVRRVVMLSILAVVCAVLVLFASGRLRSPWLGCRVIAAAIGGIDSDRAHGVAPAPVALLPRVDAEPRHADHVHDVASAALTRAAVRALKAMRTRSTGTPSPSGSSPIAVTMSPGVRRFISRGAPASASSPSRSARCAPPSSRRSRATRRRPSPRASARRRGGHQRGDVGGGGAVAAGGGRRGRRGRRGAGLRGLRGGERRGRAPAGVGVVGAVVVWAAAREWVATNANEVQMSLEDDIRRACAPVSAEAAALRDGGGGAGGGGASAPEAAVAAPAPPRCAPAVPMPPSPPPPSPAFARRRGGRRAAGGRRTRRS